MTRLAFEMYESLKAVFSGNPAFCFILLKVCCTLVNVIWVLYHHRLNRYHPSSVSRQLL